MQPYERLRNYLLGSDIFVLPSIEPWGCAINEAIAAGLAILTSDMVAGWFDMVEPGVNGFVHRAGSIASLAAHMTALIAHPGMIEEMKRASLRQAKKFSFDVMTKGILAAVNGILAAVNAVQGSGKRPRHPETVQETN